MKTGQRVFGFLTYPQLPSIPESPTLRVDITYFQNPGVEFKILQGGVVLI